VSTVESTCHRCGDEVYLVATMPARPNAVLTGYRMVVLCPRCDAPDPAAQGLLAYFAYHGKDIDATDETLTALAEEWAATVMARPTGVDAAALDDDIAEWERGRRAGE
jgi:hypothetical protein